MALLTWLALASGALANSGGDSLAGPHLSLTVAGVPRDAFRCPETTSATMVFVPDDGDGPLSLRVEWIQADHHAPRLQVVDACSEGLPHRKGGRSDPARLRLPFRREGYGVYAVAAPALWNPPVAVPMPETIRAEDGSHLLFLGLLTPQGAFNPEGLLVAPPARSKGRGHREDTDLAPLLEWTGTVCYLPGQLDDPCETDGENLCSPEALCCTDGDADGIAEWCDLLRDFAEDPEESEGSLRCPASPTGEPSAEPAVARCREYRFEGLCRVPELAGRVCAAAADGSVAMRLRFYPVPPGP